MKPVISKTSKHSFLLQLVLLMTVAGCSSLKPSYDKLLPDSGATTAELLGAGKEVADFFGTGEQADYLGTPLVSEYAPNSSYSLAHVDELRRDFQKVPNPQIVAYVFPHLSGGDLPVPGYYTVFNLYDQDHYALSSEGHRESQ